MSNAGNSSIPNLYIIEYQPHTKFKKFANDSHQLPVTGLLRKMLSENRLFSGAKLLIFSQISQAFPEKTAFAKK